MGNSLRREEKQSLDTEKGDIDYQAEVQRISKQLENDEKVKNMQEVVKMRKTCLYRDLTDPSLTYDQVRASMIYRTGGIRNNYNVDDYCNEYCDKNIKCEGCKECKQIWDQIEQKDDYDYPYIGDLIVRYFSGKDTYLLDFLKEFEEFFNKKFRLSCLKTYSYISVYNQIYLAIINGKENINFNECKIGSLSYHNFASYWSIETSLNLLEFILKNRFFISHQFNIWSLNGMYDIYEVISFHKIVFRLAKMDENNLKLIKSMLEKLDKKINTSVIFKFFDMINGENNSIILNIIKTLISCSNAEAIVKSLSECPHYFKSVFRLFYDSSVSIKVVDKCFIFGCSQYNKKIAKFLSKQQFPNRKYKLYFSRDGSINTYRIKYL
jgi:hypothetical protein